MVWVKNFEWRNWFYEKYLGFSDGKIETIDGTGRGLVWDQYSILNPYPDSIEAAVIELLRVYVDDSATTGGEESESNKFLKGMVGYIKSL